MTEKVKGINIVIHLNLYQMEAKKDYIETISSFPPHPPPGAVMLSVTLKQNLLI